MAARLSARISEEAPGVYLYREPALSRGAGPFPFTGMRSRLGKKEYREDQKTMNQRIACIRRAPLCGDPG